MNAQPIERIPEEPDDEKTVRMKRVELPDLELDIDAVDDDERTNPNARL